jgi:hypothetical protein
MAPEELMLVGRVSLAPGALNVIVLYLRQQLANADDAPQTTISRHAAPLKTNCFFILIFSFETLLRATHSKRDFLAREKVVFLVNTTDAHTEYATLPAADRVVRKGQTPKLIQ